MKLKIVLIEPDRHYRRLISEILSKDFELITAMGLNEGYSVISAEGPDIIILDPLYPDKEGLAFIKSVREFSDCPIIAVSANGTERAVVSIVTAGADDYIRKPFFSEEFKARVEACSRRIAILEAARGLSRSEVYINGDLRLEFNTHSLFIEQQPIHLTKNEFKILALLCRHSGKVLTNDFILKSVWGPKTDCNTGILRVNIANLRRKLEINPQSPKYLFTINGVGYKVAESKG